MSRMLAALATACLLSSAAAEQRETAPEPAPRIRVEPEAFDFGRALPERTLRKVFRLTNAGERELVLQKPRTSCGCAVGELTATKLAPGRSTQLTVRLETGRNRGRIEKSVLVPSNDPKRPLLEIKLQATIEAAAKK